MSDYTIPAQTTPGEHTISNWEDISGLGEYTAVGVHGESLGQECHGESYSITPVKESPFSNELKRF